jgi:peptide/nickel transport system permease protein
MVGLAIILGFVAIAALAPVISPHPGDAYRSFRPDAPILQPPGGAYPLGTDEFGRDVLTRVYFGAQLALVVGASVVALGFAIGAPLGLIAGYRRGPLGEAIMRLTDMFLAFPPLLLALIIVATLGRGLFFVTIALAVSWWPWYTRLIYAQVLSLKGQPFVEAATALGLPHGRILVKHIFPHTLPAALVQASLDMGTAILEVAALSYLGLGAQPPAPDWGLTLSRAVEIPSFWWYGTFPGLAIFLLVLGFNLLGDGVREATDPRLRRGRAA